MIAAVASAAPAAADPPPMPGIEIDGDSNSCTAGFAAQGADGFYLMTSGHCDRDAGAEWTYGDDNTLGYMAASESDDSQQLDAAIILLDPDIGAPEGDIDGRYFVSGFLDGSQLQIGMPICKVGATTGETCGEITNVDGGVVETSVFSLHGDSGSPGFVKNPDGTVSAVGILSGSPDGDDYTTYFVLVGPLLGKWGLSLLP
ncbi:MAG: S1 family peptidase [Mycobacterium sp.]